MRKQLAILRAFLARFDFLAMSPDDRLIRGGLPKGASACALARAGLAYAIYVNGGTQADLVLELPAGRYRAEWLNPRTGAIDKAEDLDHGGGRATLDSPAYQEDIALRLVARP